MSRLENKETYPISVPFHGTIGCITGTLEIFPMRGNALVESLVRQKMKAPKCLNGFSLPKQQ